MINKGLFKKPQNELEGNREQAEKKELPPDFCIICTSCKKTVFKKDLYENVKVCPLCGYYYKMTARQRLASLCDEKSFKEHDKELTAKNLIGFPDYDEKLEKAVQTSKENEGVITGAGRIGGYKTCIFAMEAGFIMGSMGFAVGEKITALFEYAEKKHLPVVGVTVSGGARMQEGILSLMQMAKVSGAVKKHSDGGNFYLALLTDPTTGGVTASFAMQADIIIAEPNALIGFAGPRVIEQTIRQKLPPQFQRAEYLLKTGFLDDIVDRGGTKAYITQMLKFHGGRDFE